MVPSAPSPSNIPIWCCFSSTPTPIYATAGWGPAKLCCATRRCLEVLLSGQLLQLAIRSGTREEFQELAQTQRLIHHRPDQDSTALATSLRQALAPHQGKPLYLTVDLDWFDPAVMPGTGTPEPGGFLWPHFAALIEVLQEHQLVAADVVELAPQLDPSGISSVLASKVTRSLLMLLSNEGNQ